MITHTILSATVFHDARQRDPRDDPVDVLEGWFEMLGRLGTAGRAAIPRLEACRTHPNPWVRMWAAEAIEKIVPADPH